MVLVFINVPLIVYYFHTITFCCIHYILFPSAAYFLIRIIFIFLETSGSAWQTQIAGQRQEGGKMKSDGILHSCHRSLQKGNEEWQERKDSKEKWVQKNCRRKTKVTFSNKKRLHTHTHTHTRTHARTHAHTPYFVSQKKKWRKTLLLPFSFLKASFFASFITFSNHDLLLHIQWD